LDEEARARFVEAMGRHGEEWARVKVRRSLPFCAPYPRLFFLFPPFSSLMPLPLSLLCRK
jgi:hypothetical protein